MNPKQIPFFLTIDVKYDPGYLNGKKTMHQNPSNRKSMPRSLIIQKGLYAIQQLVYSQMFFLKINVLESFNQ